MYVNGKNTIVKDNANTKDIIQALCDIVPVAVDQCRNSIDTMIYKSGNPLIDAERCCRYIRANVNYKADGFSEQNIQLPGRMFLKTKQADCKSFSLAFLAMMEALGHDAGFRFASYRKNKIPTHVYNYVVCDGKKYTFDSCVENLKESPRHTYIQDMKVQYLTGSPIMQDYTIEGREERQARRAERRENRQERREERKSSGGGRGRVVKKITLAPVRAAFISLLELNIRGLATKLSKAIEKDSTTAQAMWEKLGGNFNKLKNIVNSNKNKKAIFGQGKKSKGVGFYYADTEDAYIGVVDWVLVGTIVAAATPALIAVTNLLKKNNIPEEEGSIITADEKNAGEPLPEGFEAADAEAGSGLNLGFKPSPLMIGGIVGGLALVYFLTKKKK